MDCPNCKLVNPPAATRCDCGYDFHLQTMREPHLAESNEQVSVSRREVRTVWLCLFSFLALGLLPWFFLFSLSGMAWDSGNPLRFRDYIFLAWVWTFPLTLAAALIFRRRMPALILLLCMDIGCEHPQSRSSALFVSCRRGACNRSCQNSGAVGRTGNACT